MSSKNMFVDKRRRHAGFTMDVKDLARNHGNGTRDRQTSTARLPPRRQVMRVEI